jgi:hypothetical protein
VKRPVSREVEPAVFNYVRDYAIDVIEASKKQPVPRVSLGPLTVFIDNLFAQYFRAALNTTITDFSDRSHEVAVKVRLRMEGAGGEEEIVAMISSYESYCRIHPDIEQERSVPDDAEAFDEIQSTLLESFLPELLDRVEAWAAVKEHTRIVEAAQAAREYLESAKVELGL